jgi:hypothetical protein
MMEIMNRNLVRPYLVTPKHSYNAQSSPNKFKKSSVMVEHPIISEHPVIIQPQVIVEQPAILELGIQKGEPEIIKNSDGHVSEYINRNSLLCNENSEFLENPQSIYKRYLSYVQANGYEMPPLKVKKSLKEETDDSGGLVSYVNHALLFEFQDPSKLEYSEFEQRIRALMTEEQSSYLPDFRLNDDVLRMLKEMEDIEIADKKRILKVVDTSKIKKYSKSQLTDSVRRYKAKKDKRTNPSNIRYVVRQVIAGQRPRFRGKFKKLDHSVNSTVSANCNKNSARCSPQEPIFEE